MPRDIGNFNPMEIGNWIVDNEEIRWHGDNISHFAIPIQALNETTIGPKGELHYSGILLATEEDWLTEDDLIDLNYAFVYALAKHGLDFDYNIFDDTLAEQYEQLDEEDDDSSY